MILIDAQLPPTLAPWIVERFGEEATAVRDVNLRDAEDQEIFDSARGMNAIVLTKDEDFVELHNRLGPPPKVIWLTCGNTTNARLREILEARLREALTILMGAESLVEISGM